MLMQIVQGGSLYSIQEITAFTLSFSGNTLVQAFTHTFSDLTVLSYRPAKSVLGDQNPEGLATNWFGTTGFFYISGTAVAGQQGAFVQNIGYGGIFPYRKFDHCDSFSCPRSRCCLVVWFSIGRTYRCCTSQKLIA